MEEGWLVGGSGDSLALYLVKCLEICLFEITIFEVHASAVKAQVRHLNYKKEKKKLSVFTLQGIINLYCSTSI